MEQPHTHCSGDWQQNSEDAIQNLERIEQSPKLWQEQHRRRQAVASEEVTELHLSQGFHGRSLSVCIFSLDQVSLGPYRACHHAPFTSCAANTLEGQRAGRRNK